MSAQPQDPVPDNYLFFEIDLPSDIKDDGKFDKEGEKKKIETYIQTSKTQLKNILRQGKTSTDIKSVLIIDNATATATRKLRIYVPIEKDFSNKYSVLFGETQPQDLKTVDITGQQGQEKIQQAQFLTPPQDPSPSPPQDPSPPQNPKQKQRNKLQFLYRYGSNEEKYKPLFFIYKKLTQKKKQTPQAQQTQKKKQTLQTQKQTQKRTQITVNNTIYAFDNIKSVCVIPSLDEDTQDLKDVHQQFKRICNSIGNIQQTYRLGS